MPTLLQNFTEFGLLLTEIQKCWAIMFAMRESNFSQQTPPPMSTDPPQSFSDSDDDGPSPQPSDAPATPPSDLFPSPLSPSEARALGKQAIRSFLSSRTTYDAMPKSGRVVVFDVNINLRLVLYALLEHEIRAAPLWNPSVQKLVGMVTMSDFVDVFTHCGKIGEYPADVLDFHTVLSWRTLLGRVKNNQSSASAEEQKGKRCAQSIVLANLKNRPAFDFVSISPDASLLDACATLRREHVHRLPIVDTDGETCLQVITFQTILTYLTTQFAEERRLFDQSIQELNVGTFENIASATCNTSLEDVIDLIDKRGVSTLPILENATSGKVVHMYRRSFTANLRVEELDELLKLPVGEVLKRYEAYSAAGGSGTTSPPPSSSVEGGGTAATAAPEDVYTCKSKETLYQVFKTFAESKTRTLVIVDENDKLQGICSLSDVLCYFL